MLAFRALLSFLALPGLVAFVVPLAVLRPAGVTISWFGAPFLALGIAALLLCTVEFATRGRGTLAPWDPPRGLVRTGLYRWTRNPMYVAVASILVGWAITFRSPALAAYAGVIAIAFQLRVVLGEEPWLARQFGADWDEYKARVPRWLF